MTPRQTAILKHISRYGLTLRPVLDRLFFNGVERGCEKDIAALRKLKMLSVVENAVPDPENEHIRLSYYLLTRPATKILGVPSTRANKPGSESFPRNLAILWFCCMRKSLSHRLEKSELAELFADENPPIKVPYLHCLVSNGKHRLLNIYVPGTSVPEAKRQLKNHLEEVQEIPRIAEAIREQQYGFIVLVESAELRDVLRKELGSVFGKSRVGYFVAVAPGPWKR